MTARSDIDERLLDEALAWHHALDRDDADWDAYALWLETSPGHRQAFDEIALTDRIVSDRVDDLRQLRAIEPPGGVTASVTRRKWLPGAVAAAIAVAIGVPALRHQPGDTVYMTARGETRRVALGQGVAVALAPSSRLVAVTGDPTKLELVEGDAYFAVAHDPSRMLAIKAGDYAVTDIGTKFGINLSPDIVTVAVAEGHVSVARGDGQATTVAAGQQIAAERAGHAARLSGIDVGAVGSWRQGRLVYSNTPLRVVAADISRYSGRMVTVDPAIRDRPFSGVLAIGDGSRLLANLSDLMAISYEEHGDRVRIRAADDR